MIRRAGAATIGLLAWTLGILTCQLGIAQETAATTTLHFSDQGQMIGQWLVSDDPRLLHWRSPQFEQPFQVPTKYIAAIHWAELSPRPRPSGAFVAELYGDDVIYGELQDIDSDLLTMETAHFGIVRIARSQIRRVYRQQAGGRQSRPGSTGFGVWVDATDRESHWTDLSGMPSTDEPGASIYGEFGIPELATIELNLSWKRRPDFVLALGVDEDMQPGEQAFGIEVWDNHIIAIGESARDADFASVASFRSGTGSLRIRLYLDQPRRRLGIYSHRGERLASLSIRPGSAKSQTGLRLTNGQGDVRLDSLRIISWDGRPPQPIVANAARLHAADGAIHYGELASFDPTTQQFTLLSGEHSLQIAAATVTDIFLSPVVSGAVPKNAPVEDHTDPVPRFRAIYQDGSRVTGKPLSFESNRLWLRSPAIVKPLPLPTAGLRSIFGLDPRQPTSAPQTARKGRLEMQGVSLDGFLESTPADPEGGSISWQPMASLTASRFKKQVSGKIDYRAPSSPRRTALATARDRRPQGFGESFKKVITFGVPTTEQNSPQRLLHLRTGDSIPAEVSRIDDQGVTFTTPVAATTFVPHWAIKAIEFNGTSQSLNLTQVERDRLLTLPRVRRSAPPTHLIGSPNADFLRGHIVDMDDSRLKLEVRLVTKEIPRDRVAHIIWLHADELDGSLNEHADASSDPDLIVQAVRADGRRLTFVAESFAANCLTGTSAVLGVCRIELGEIDRLLIGSQIEQASTELAFHPWKLRHAPDPKFVSSGDGSDATGGLTGMKATLVGQLAPEFELPLLDGTSFELAEHRGSVVVIDFWATWCGPCLETMPLVEAVTQDYAEHGVKLLAINLEEQPTQIRSMLERHQFTMRVGLDRDGLVASKYEVRAIPQTVVIDREGRVSRLFVGGGPKLESPLRMALDQLVAP